MSCLGCNLIETAAHVTLQTGKVVCTSCPDHMRECLVRDIAKMEKRSTFFEQYSKHHGENEAKKLAGEVRAEIARGKGKDLFA